jgi:DNA-binding NarL/FixJ family response regulator
VTIKAFRPFQALSREQRFIEMTTAPLRLLLVDDHEADRREIIRALERGGFGGYCQRAATINTLRRALRVKEAWNLVVCDAPLGQLAIDRVLELVHQRAPALPILLMSAAPEGAFRDQLLDGRADGFVSKQRLADLPAMVAFLRTPHVGIRSSRDTARGWPRSSQTTVTPTGGSL